MTRFAWMAVYLGVIFVFSVGFLSPHVFDGGAVIPIVQMALTFPSWILIAKLLNPLLENWSGGAPMFVIFMLSAVVNAAAVCAILEFGKRLQRW